MEACVPQGRGGRVSVAVGFHKRERALTVSAFPPDSLLTLRLHRKRLLRACFSSQLSFDKKGMRGGSGNALDGIMI